MGLVGARRSGIRGARTGFTLVELLTVIGIIALLIAILLPALGRVRSHAKATQTAGLLNAIEKGLEAFAADMGGYPDSRFRKDPIEWPDLPNTRELSGAHWLARAMVGHDLGGVDTQGDTLKDGERGTESLATYADASRRSLYFDAETMARDTDKTAFPGLTMEETPPRTTNPNPMFRFRPTGRLVVREESFGSPVLYYRANPRAPEPFCYAGEGRADPGATGDRLGIYRQGDNAGIAGRDLSGGLPDNKSAGWDFSGVGIEHELRTFDAFAGFLRNPTGPEGMIVPHNQDRFILLTPGPDCVFGTRDDIGNFPIRK